MSSPMLFRLCLVFILCFTALPARASEEPSGERRKPGLVSRFFNLFRGSRDRSEGTSTTNWKRLVMTMNIEPLPLHLSESRQMKVTLRLSNKSRRLIQLEFPTTQRIEVLVRSAGGKLVEQWSEDQAFANEPTLVTINPGERLEYPANIATRDLVAGQSYTVIGYFPNYEQLKATKVIVPEK
jgi:hypothetical protein